MLPMPFPDDNFMDNGSQPDVRSDDADRRLAWAVSQRVARALGGRTGRIAVGVQNRVVLLDGAVDSAATAHAVAGLAWDVAGVVDVRNSLRWPPRGQ